MNSVVIIPARLGASRFPGKPLANIAGIPMIGHCYFRAKLTPGIDDVFVATCDEEIAKYVHSIGGKFIMTSNTHTRASTRTAEALEIIESNTDKKIDIVVMFQGDEPLISPEDVAKTINNFSDSSVKVVNIMSQFRSIEAFKDKNNVKVVVDKNNDALYFSREPIPSLWKESENVPHYMQTGIISFRRDALYNFNNTSETMLERVESIDLNRILESGNKVRMIPTDKLTIGVDTPDELKNAEKILLSDPIFKLYS